MPTLQSETVLLYHVFLVIVDSVQFFYFYINLESRGQLALW